MNRDKFESPSPEPLELIHFDWKQAIGVRAELTRTLQRTFVATGLLLAAACAGTQTTPTQQLMVDVQAANRSANELGAQQNPQAQLHLKLAEEQLKQAKVAMENDDNERADGLLMRAKADAELAVALTKEGTATSAADKAVDPSGTERSTTPPGATP